MQVIEYLTAIAWILIDYVKLEPFKATIAFSLFAMVVMLITIGYMFLTNKFIKE
jgi:hypothetical protein